jgi:uncharacterized membrane protein YeaQ/YmgE (transglycosylase-associated protein family)
MNIIIWLVVGGLSGWLASKFMDIGGEQGILRDVVIGVAGAVLGGWFLTPLLGVATINQSDFSLPSLVVSLLGAIGLLAIVRIVRSSAVG